MKFAKVVFWIAAIWGVFVLAPLYFLFNVIGQQDPPQITGFYYGFLGTALAWQIAFMFIANNPVRLRPMMIPSVLEKFSYGIAVVVLVMEHRMHAQDLIFGCGPGVRTAVHDCVLADQPCLTKRTRGAPGH
jgi:hypothetical protein